MAVNVSKDISDKIYWCIRTKKNIQQGHVAYGQLGRCSDNCCWDGTEPTRFFFFIYSTVIMVG